MLSRETHALADQTHAHARTRTHTQREMSTAQETNTQSTGGREVDRETVCTGGSRLTGLIMSQFIN